MLVNFWQCIVNELVRFNQNIVNANAACVLYHFSLEEIAY